MKAAPLTFLNPMILKEKKVFFLASFEEVSILRKFAILFLLSSIIPMALLSYVYFEGTHLRLPAMVLMVLGVLVGYLSIRSLLAKAIDIAKENRRAIDPFLTNESVKEFDRERNELIVLRRTFYVVTKELETSINELKTKNEELKALDLLKDDFIHNVTHEFRLPLTIIQESLNQMAEGMCGSVSETQLNYLNRSLRNIHRLKTLIDNMLDISKIENGKLEISIANVDIKEVIKEVVFDFSQQISRKGLEFKTDLPTGPMEALADKDKITQVFVNLVGNACKFTQKGFIKISVKENWDSIECSVEDSGVGIAAKDVPFLFSKYHQINRNIGQEEKGTGLGLVISKHIVELHQGQMRVESKEGFGTTFSFNLPKASPVAEERTNTMKKILLVDDDVDLIELVQNRLKANNYEVIYSNDGNNGVKKALEEKPDLIIMDILMPHMHGGEAVKILKGQEETKNIPVLFLTAMNAFLPQSHDLDQVNVDGKLYPAITKPFEPNKLLSTVKFLLRE